MDDLLHLGPVITNMSEQYDRRALVIKVVPCDQNSTDIHAISTKDLIEVDESGPVDSSSIRVVPHTQRHDADIAYIASWQDLVSIAGDFIDELSDAVWKRDYQKVYYLICLASDNKFERVSGESGETALLCMAHCEDKYLFEAVLKRTDTNAVLLQATAGYGNTVLHELAYRKDTTNLQSLIKIRPDLMSTLANTCNNQKIVPLRIAINRGLSEVAEILIKYTDMGNLGSPDSHGLTMRHEAVDCYFLERLIRIKAADGCTPLHMAAYTDRADVAKTIYGEMSSEGICKQTTEKGYTALHIAVTNKSIPMITVLLVDLEKSRGLLSITDIDGQTALDLARASSQEVFNCITNLTKPIWSLQ